MKYARQAQTALDRLDVALAKLRIPLFAIQQSIPPAKLSPAPVGSKTLILGTTPILIFLLSCASNEPLLPFLITTIFAPFCKNISLIFN